MLDLQNAHLQLLHIEEALAGGLRFISQDLLIASIDVTWGTWRY